MTDAPKPGEGWFDRDQPFSDKSLDEDIERAREIGERMADKYSTRTGDPQYDRDVKHGQIVLVVFVLGTMILTRRYMKKRIPQLVRVDMLAEDKILATFTRGRPVVLSLVVDS